MPGNPVAPPVLLVRLVLQVLFLLSAPVDLEALAVPVGLPVPLPQLLQLDPLVPVGLPVPLPQLLQLDPLVPVALVHPWHP